MMFSHLIEGARALRIQLLAGYSVLFSSYISLRGRLFENAEPSETEALIIDLHSYIGTAGRAALWTFVALTLGSIISNVFFSDVIERITSAGGRVDWSAFIREAQVRVQNYEEYEVRIPGTTGNTFSTDSQRYSVPSPHRAALLQEEVEQRERHKAEIDFRMALALSLLLPALALTIRGGPAWVVCFLPSLVILYDAGRLQDRTLAYMNRSRRRVLVETIEQTSGELEQWQSQSDSVPGDSRLKPRTPDQLEKIASKRDGSIARLKQELKQLESELATLNAQRDERFSLKARLRAPTADLLSEEEPSGSYRNSRPLSSEGWKGRPRK